MARIDGWPILAKISAHPEAFANVSQDVAAAMISIIRARLIAGPHTLDNLQHLVGLVGKPALKAALRAMSADEVRAVLSGLGRDSRRESGKEARAALLLLVDTPPEPSQPALSLHRHRALSARRIRKQTRL